jgi:aspartate oxidase
LALQREESRGSHIRSDFPNQDERFAKDSVIQKDEI